MQPRGFDSLEAMLETIQAQERLANAAVTERQRVDLVYGSYGFRLVDGEIPVWTRIFTEAEAAEGEEPGTIADLRSAYERGYRYGMHYSVVEPDGELGSVHIASMWPVSKRDFDIGQEIGWAPSQETLPWFRNLLEIMQRQFEDAKRGVVHSKFDADENEGQTFHVVDEGEDE